MKHKNLYLGATLGLAFGVVALTPVLVTPFTAVNVYAVEGETLEVNTYDEFYDAIVNGTAATVKLASDIEELTRTVEVPASRIVTIDLNGHTLTVRNNTTRGIINRGQLSIIGGGLIRNGYNTVNNTSYGILDNYGTATISNVFFEENGAKQGASIRNNGRDAKLYINEGTVIAVQNAENGNVGVSATMGEVYIADGVEITSPSDTLFPIQVKNGSLTVGTQGSENPAKITGKIAGIYVFGNGKTTINNAEVSSSNGSGVKVVTNKADVTLNGGEFKAPYGGVYVYTTAEGAAPIVTINGGEFSGEWASIVSTDISGDVKGWAVDVKGGVFAGMRIREYLRDGYSAYKIPEYFENGWNGYIVRSSVVENIPATIYLKKGTQANLGLSENALQYATVTLDRNDVIVLDGNTITSGKTGIVTVTTDLNDGTEPIRTIVYSYDTLVSVELVDGTGLDPADVAAFEPKLVEGENKIGYIDIDYARIIDGVEFDKVNAAAEPVTVLINLPELPAVAEGYKRSFRLLHILDGSVVEVEDATFNTKENTLGFETTTFRPFLVTYTDTLIPVPDEPDEPVVDPHEPSHPSVPKDDTLDFEDPGELDPLGETYTEPGTAGDGTTVGVPNTANTDSTSASELNILLAMMLGSVLMTTVVLGARKAYLKR